MIMQNLGLQESIGVKHVNDICTKFCLQRLFENNWYFVILLSQNGFKCDQETKFQTMNHFIKSVLKKTYTNVLQNICS